ncbi:MAG: hypothetical protein M0P35_00520 [Bacteroidales bacterium]|jgi:hypothetical protein|nr:hypothetical protein [Bacteroidales bacterium]
MSVYLQKKTWQEDGAGLITVLFAISDSYEELFEDGIYVDIFDFEDIGKSIQADVGGFVTAELKLNIDESNVNTTLEKDVLAFALQGFKQETKRYIALFINPTETRTEADLLFYGIIQPDFENEDIYWRNRTEYDGDVNSLKMWRLIAKPYSSDILEGFELKELIEAIPNEWIEENVKHRPGYYRELRAGDDKPSITAVLNQFPLDALLQEIARLSSEIYYNKTGINIEIEFQHSPLDGKFFPARWNTATKEQGAVAQILTPYRYVKSPVNAKSYETYADDGQELILVSDAVIPDIQRIWLNFGIVGHTISEIEPQKGAAEHYQFTQYKTFKDLLTAIAIAYGVYVSLELIGDILYIKFIRRADFVRDVVYLRSAIASKTKITALDFSNQTKYVAEANYLANEGLKYYNVDDTLNEFKDRKVTPSRTYKALSDNAKQLPFSLSPTVAAIYPGYDNGENFLGMAADDMAYLPHNTSHAKITYPPTEIIELESKPFRTVEGVHSAMYLNCVWSSWHTNYGIEALNYWTHAAKYVVKLRGVNREFNSLADYVNFLQVNDTDNAKYEKELKSPYFLGFSQNADGSNPSWDALQLGSLINIEGIEYVVIDISYNFHNLEVDIKLSALSRFDYDDVDIEEFEEEEEELAGEIPRAVDKFTFYIADENIPANAIVSLKNNGRIEFARPYESHYRRILGFIKRSVEAEATVPVQLSGTFPIPDDWSDLIPNTIYYLRWNVGSGMFAPGQEPMQNFKLEYLQGRTGEEVLHCPVGMAVDTRNIQIFKNFPDQAIFQFNADN